MSDELKQPEENTGTWVMPEPVFRSSEGYTPKTAARGRQDDIPTEPGFNNEDTEESLDISENVESVHEDDHHQSVRASTKTRVRHHKKRSGCAKLFGIIAGTIAVALTSILFVLVYFLFFYRTSDTTF